MVMFLQYVIGGLLILMGVLIWRARFKSGPKRFLERTFLDPGDDLFAKNQPYSGTVRWMRYAAIPAGLAMVVPTVLAIDIVLGLLAFGAYYWMDRQRRAHKQQLKADAESTK